MWIEPRVAAAVYAGIAGCRCESTGYSAGRSDLREELKWGFVDEDDTALTSAFPFCGRSLSLARGTVAVIISLADTGAAMVTRRVT
jgi:hypothetical protein